MFHSCRYRPCFVCFMFHVSRRQALCFVCFVFHGPGQKRQFRKIFVASAGGATAADDTTYFSQLVDLTLESLVTVNHTRCMDSKTPHLPPLAGRCLLGLLAIPTRNGYLSHLPTRDSQRFR